MTRVCSKCYDRKDIELFPTSTCNKDGRKAHCRKCEQKRIDKRRLDNKLKLLEYLKDKVCIDCGNSNPVVLEFDHREKKESRDHSIIVMLQNRLSWNRILDEIAKCDIRCANCHRIKTAKAQNCFKLLSSDKLPGY